MTRRHRPTEEELNERLNEEDKENATNALNGCLQFLALLIILIAALILGTP